MREDRQLGHVVEDDEGEEGDQHHKRRLVDALLDVDADVAANHALNQQQKNQPAIENRERHQVQDAEVEADFAGQSELRHPSLHLRRVAGHARNAHRSGKLRDGDPVREDPLQHFDDQEGVVRAEIGGLGNGRPNGSGLSRKGAAPWRTPASSRVASSLAGCATMVHRCAVAQYRQRDRLALPRLHVSQQRGHAYGRDGHRPIQSRRRRAGRPVRRAFPASLPARRSGRA